MMASLNVAAAGPLNFVNRRKIIFFSCTFGRADCPNKSSFGFGEYQAFQALK